MTGQTLVQVVAIDEAQFFDDLTEVTLKWARELNKTVPLALVHVHLL